MDIAIDLSNAPDHLSADGSDDTIRALHAANAIHQGKVYVETDPPADPIEFGALVVPDFLNKGIAARIWNSDLDQSVLSTLATAAPTIDYDGPTVTDRAAHLDASIRAAANPAPQQSPLEEAI